MVSHLLEPAHWKRSRGTLQSVQRRGAGKLCSLFPGHYALHQRIDHDAVAYRGDSAAWPDGAGRRWAAKDHAVDALRDGRPVHFPGLSAGIVISAPGIVSYDAAGDHRHDQESRNSAGRRPWLDVSHRNGGFLDDRRAFIDVARRSNHRARYWQRNLAHHHHWHCRAFTCCIGTSVEDLCAFGANRVKPSESNGPGIAGIVPDHRHCSGNRHHTRRAKDHTADKRSICL